MNNTIIKQGNDFTVQPMVAPVSNVSTKPNPEFTAALVDADNALKYLTIILGQQLENQDDIPLSVRAQQPDYPWADMFDDILS